MTRKHYKLLADVLGTLRQDAAHCFDNDDDYYWIALRFADKLKEDNPQFSYVKFLEACGAMKPEPEE